MAWETRIPRQLFDSKILKLNDAILLQIFMLNTEFDFDMPHIPGQTIRYTSQVSRQWRRVALNSPMLWATSLNFADEIPWIQTALDRAKNSPLNISYPPLSKQVLSNQSILSKWRHLEYEHRMTLVQETWHGPIDVKKLDMALSLLTRCRRFRLVLYNDKEWDYAWEKSISLTAPRLEELVVVVTARQSGEARYYRLKQPAESNIFDAGVSSKLPLKTLHLSGFGLKLHGISFQSEKLTTLIIKGREDTRSFTVDEWLNILPCFPQLEVLHFGHCFKIKNWNERHKDTENLKNGPQTFLSKLQSIKLEGNWDKVSLMLSRIRFPPLCAMDFRFCYVEDGQSSLATQTLSMVHERIEDFIGSQKVVDLSLFMKRYPGLGWKFWNNIHSGDERTLSVSWIPEADEYCDGDLYFQYLKQILQVISPNVLYLYLDTAKIGDHESAYDAGILRGFQNLESLCISSAGALKYVWMLLNDNQAAKEDPMLLPALKHITLGSLSITKKKKSRVSRIFSMRSELGSPIPRCHVKGCRGKALKGLINDLRELGVQVEWDEKAGSIEEEDNDHDSDTQTDLGHLAIQTEWDGSYKDDGENQDDSQDEMFESDFSIDEDSDQD